jgi:two-component system sensor histidine kinase YesM
MKLTNRWLGIHTLHLQFRSKLILSFFTVISLTALIMGYSYYHIMREELETSTLQKFEGLTAQTVNTLNLHLKSIGNTGLSYFSDTFFQRYLDNPSTFEDQQYYRDKLSVQRKQNPLVSAINVVRLDGKELSSNYYYNSELRGLITQELNRVGRIAMQQDGFPFWTASFTTPSNSLIPVQTISYVQQLKRIKPSSQHPVGFLKIDMNPLVLDNVFQGLQDNNGSTYYLIDAEGNIVFTKEKDKIGQSLETDPIFMGYKRFMGNLISMNYRFQREGEDYIGFYHKLDYNGWIVLGSAPLDRVLQKVSTFKITVILIGLTSFLTAMLLAYIIAASVTRPLKELNKKMKQVEMGNFKAFIKVKGGDELSNIQYSFNRMTSEIRELISKVYETELLKREAEVKALQSQINPHFLYNTLSTIDSISSINGEHRISFICQALGDLLRHNLNGGNFGTVKDEAHYLEQYLSIYQLRFGDQFRYKIQIEPLTELVIMPKFLLQPLVENAIIHGLENKIGYKEVRVVIHSINEQMLEVIIEDNGVGIDPTTMSILQKRIYEKYTPANGQSPPNRLMIGLLNVFKRIEMYYNLNPEFHIRSHPGEGTTITFSLPKQMRGGSSHEDHDR